MVTTLFRETVDADFEVRDRAADIGEIKCAHVGGSAKATSMFGHCVDAEFKLPDRADDIGDIKRAHVGGSPNEPLVREIVGGARARHSVVDVAPLAPGGVGDARPARDNRDLILIYHALEHVGFVLQGSETLLLSRIVDTNAREGAVLCGVENRPIVFTTEHQLEFDLHDRSHDIGEIKLAHMGVRRDRCVATEFIPDQLKSFDRNFDQSRRHRVRTNVHVDDSGEGQRPRASERDALGLQGMGNQEQVPIVPCRLLVATRSRDVGEIKHRSSSRSAWCTVTAEFKSHDRSHHIGGIKVRSSSGAPWRVTAEFKLPDVGAHVGADSYARAS